MTWIAPKIERTDPPYVNNERDSLQSWLDYHRQTLLWKCQDLTGEQLCQAPVATSTLTLLGLARHMAEVERWWFRRNFAAEPISDLFCTEEFPDGDFDLLVPANAEADFAAIRAEWAAADAAVAGRSLDETYHSQRRGIDIDLRWVYVHVLEEYARHNGHADIIRELIDGTTGD
jgi:hypothetical protein